MSETFRIAERIVEKQTVKQAHAASVNILKRNDLQREIAVHIVTLGGYWRPMSAVVRVAEELGEVVEAMQDGDDGKILAELADLFIITTCLANQYCIQLDDLEVAEAPLDDGGKHTSLRDRLNTLMTLVTHSGRLSRTVNAYDGEKPAKADEIPVSISDSIDTIHLVIFQYVVSAGGSLDTAVNSAMERSARRDRKRFTAKYDPSSATAVKLFGNIASVSPCIFAKSARVWGAPSYRLQKSLTENVDAAMDALLHFGRAAVVEQLDGFVMQLDDPMLHRDIETFCNTIRHVLTTIDNYNKPEERCMKKDMLSPTWRFKLFNQTYFVTTFAPFYNLDHPRHSSIPGSSFVFFQPEESFDHHGVSGNNPKRSAIKKSIRENFEKWARPYAGQLSAQLIEALKYIKPLDAHAKPLFWWYADTSRADATPTPPGSV